MFVCVLTELGEEYCPSSQFLLPVLESDSGKQSPDNVDSLEVAWQVSAGLGCHLAAILVLWSSKDHFREEHTPTFHRAMKELSLSHSFTDTHHETDTHTMTISLVMIYCHNCLTDYTACFPVSPFAE